MTLVRRAALGLALAAGALVTTAPVHAAPLPDPAAKVYPGESYSQWRRYGYRRGYYGPGYYRRGYGGAAAAGIAGLAAGALVAGAIASQPAYGYPGAPVGNVYGHDPNWVSYCASKYRSFDPASGTYLANDGRRYYCQ